MIIELMILMIYQARMKNKINLLKYIHGISLMQVLILKMLKHLFLVVKLPDSGYLERI